MEGEVAAGVFCQTRGKAMTKARRWGGLLMVYFFSFKSFTAASAFSTMVLALSP